MLNMLWKAKCLDLKRKRGIRVLIPNLRVERKDERKKEKLKGKKGKKERKKKTKKRKTENGIK